MTSSADIIDGDYGSMVAITLRLLSLPPTDYYRAGLRLLSLNEYPSEKWKETALLNSIYLMLLEQRKSVQIPIFGWKKRRHYQLFIDDSKHNNRAEPLFNGGISQLCLYFYAVESGFNIYDQNADPVDKLSLRVATQTLMNDIGIGEYNLPKQLLFGDDAKSIP